MRHPFATEPIKKKYAYMIGIVIAALEKGEIEEKQELYLRALAQAIELSKDDLEKTIQVGKQYQNLKEEIISVLDTSYKKYCFLADLYQMLYEKERTVEDFIEGAKSYEKQLCITDEELKEIQQIYRLQMNQKDFLSERTKALLEYEPNESANDSLERQNKETENLLLEHANKKQFIGNGETDFLEKEEVMIARGESLCIEGEYLSSQRIRVLKGGKLVFKGANVVVLKGNIVVEEGELHIENTTFILKEEIDAPLFTILGSHITVFHTTFNGNGKSYLWVQTGGLLEVNQCTFKNTVQKSAIMLWDCPSRFKQTIFKRCKTTDNAGGAVYTNSNAAFEECEFIECMAYKGAAIFRFASTIVWPSLKGNQKSEEKTKKEPFLKLFGQKVDFVPVPKHLSSIPYPLILKNNIFYKCKAIKEGVVCAYKEQAILQEHNVFEKCGLSKIAYYE